MSDLRRRIFGAGGSPDSTPSSSRDASPAPIQREDGEYKIVPKPKLDKLKKEVKEVRKKGTRRRNVWVFALGGLFGIFLAGFFASNNGSLDKLVEMAGISDMNLDTLLDVLPAGLIRDVQDLQVRNFTAALLLRRLMLTEVFLIAEK
jgi:phospholipid:diacylglycerol acyltransferase